MTQAYQSNDFNYCERSELTTLNYFNYKNINHLKT